MLVYSSAPLLCPYAGSMAMAYTQSTCCNVSVIHHQNSTLLISGAMCKSTENCRWKSLTLCTTSGRTVMLSLLLSVCVLTVISKSLLLNVAVPWQNKKDVTIKSGECPITGHEALLLARACLQMQSQFLSTAECCKACTYREATSPELCRRLKLADMPQTQARNNSFGALFTFSTITHSSPPCV